MTEQPQNNPILKRFRDALNEMYGDRLERVVLYGSRARGDAHKESDYDVAVFLRDMPDRFAEMNRLADLSTNHCRRRRAVHSRDGLSGRLVQRAAHAVDVRDPRRRH